MKAFDVPHFDAVKTRRKLLLVSVAYLFTPLSALAAPRQRPTPSRRLLDRLRQLHPGTEFTAVRPTPITGWHEVWMGHNVAYVNEQHPRYFVFGRLFDTLKSVDLTSDNLTHNSREAQPFQVREGTSPVPWSSLPLTDAIESRHGTHPQRVLAVFSDPLCGHCRALEHELDQVSNVTVHVFLLPFQGEELPRAIWCSANRTQAWQQWMRGGTRPANNTQDTACDPPLARNLALAQKLGVRGTPTMIFENGSRIEGTVTHTVIEDHLRRATEERRS